MTLTDPPRPVRAPFPAALPALDLAPPGGAPERTDEGRLALTGSTSLDRHAQGRLYDQCFRKADGVRVIPWRYDNCPHGSAIAPVARDEGGALLASYACQPRSVRFRGDARAGTTVGQTGDVMTHPSLRSRGVFTDLHWTAMQEAQREGWSAVWGLPNEHSGYIFFDKLGWRHAGHIGPWNFVLRDDAEARRIRLQNGRLAMMGTRWAHLRGRLARARMGLDGATVETLREIPQEIVAISDHVAPRHDWMVHRDAAYLTWRFLDAPCGRFRVLGIRDRSGAWVAYAVAQRPLAGDGFSAIVDLLGVDEAAEGAAMDAALAYLADRGASIVRSYAMRGTHWEAILARSGFRPPRGYKEVGAYPLWPDHPLADATLDTSRWYFTDGDRDDEFVR